MCRQLDRKLLFGLPFFSKGDARYGRTFSLVGRCLLLLISISLVACSTAVQIASDKVAELALGAIGIQLPDNPNLPRPAKTIRLHIEAAKDLNAGDDGQGLSAIMRLYKLKDQNAFLSTPYSAFGSPEKEKQAIGGDLLEVKELVLSPGQAIDLKEKLTGETTYLGMVTLFHNPDSRRWRFAFASSNADSAGITVGVHSCAMTATGAAPSGMTSNEAALLTTVKCR